MQEIFQGNTVYQPFIELMRTGDPASHDLIRLTGNILEKEIMIEKSDLRDKNTSFLVGADEFWHDK